MAIALVANVALTPPSDDGGTTGAIDTTGANFIVVAATLDALGTPAISDNKGNSYSIFLSAATGTFSRERLYYVINPTVGSGHTFTITNTNIHPTICVAAFSGVNTSSTFDVENTNVDNSSGTTIQAGSITPSNNDSLIVAAFGMTAAGSASINSGYTITDQVSTGNSWGLALAYLIQTTAAATNPTWTGPTDNSRLATIAAFNSAPSATAAIAITEGADVVAATAFANASMAVAITESADVVAATLGSTFNLAIAITESPDAIYAELGYNLNINIASEEADTISLILSNPDSWAACTDPTTAWTECSDPSTTWTNCPDPATTWTVN